MAKEKDKEPTPPTLFGEIDVDLSDKGNDAEADPLQGLPSSVKLEVADTPYDFSKTTKSEDPDGQYIQYDGVGNIRVLTPEDWKAVGIDSDQYYEWNFRNHKRIALSAFTPEQLTYLLRVDGRFSVVKVDKGEKGS